MEIALKKEALVTSINVSAAPLPTDLQKRETERKNAGYAWLTTSNQTGHYPELGR